MGCLPLKGVAGVGGVDLLFGCRKLLRVLPRTRPAGRAILMRFLSVIAVLTVITSARCAADLKQGVGNLSKSPESCRQGGKDTGGL